MNIHYDLIVVGGGLTGVSAAVAAARENCKVLLIEQYGFLGGAATNSLVNPFMPHHIEKKGDGKTERFAVSQGIFSEMVERLKDLGGMHENESTFNEELLKIVLDRMTRENDVDVLFHSFLIDVEKEEGQLKSITVANKSGKETFYGDYFIDCTGDADLAHLSGCPYKVGRSSDHFCQPMTLCFRIGNINLEAEKRRGVMAEVSKLYQQFQKEGKINNPRENVGSFDHISEGVWHFNSTRVIKHNPVDSVSLSKAEALGREQSLELYLFLKKHVKGFEGATFLMSAAQIGIRESRMIEGEYELTEKDLLSCRKFEDSVACGMYGIDIHGVDGAGTTLTPIPEGEYYTIPYRSLIPRNTSNLLVAGRCISSTHEAQSAYRIMPICSCLGEAAGYACSLAKKAGIGVKDISVKELQGVITKHGGICK